MDKIIARNMLSWLELFINRYCCICWVFYIIYINDARSSKYQLHLFLFVLISVFLHFLLPLHVQLPMFLHSSVPSMDTEMQADLAVAIHDLLSTLWFASRFLVFSGKSFQVSSIFRRRCCVSWRPCTLWHRRAVTACSLCTRSYCIKHRRSTKINTRSLKYLFSFARHSLIWGNECGLTFRHRASSI